MSAAELREEINRYLDQVDEGFLKVVHSMLDAYVEQLEENPIAGYDIYGNPKRANELMDEYEEGIAAVKRGESITVEELAEKSKEWLSRTK